MAKKRKLPDAPGTTIDASQAEQLNQELMKSYADDGLGARQRDNKQQHYQNLSEKDRLMQLMDERVANVKQY